MFLQVLRTQYGSDVHFLDAAQRSIHVNQHPDHVVVATAGIEALQMVTVSLN